MCLEGLHLFPLGATIFSAQTRNSPVAFPPNYNQERNNRAKAKQQKALDKQHKRDEKSAQRKNDVQDEQHAEPKKDE